MPKQIDEDLLIQAAAEVFAERGYAGAGVAEIARRAGVTTGAIYSRYSGKSELLLEALKRSFVLHIGEAISSAISGENKVGSFVQDGGGIRSIGLVASDEWKAHDALFLEAVVASRRDEEIATMLSERLEKAASFLAKESTRRRQMGLWIHHLIPMRLKPMLWLCGWAFQYCDRWIIKCLNQKNGKRY